MQLIWTKAVAGKYRLWKTWLPRDQVKPTCTQPASGTNNFSAIIHFGLSSGTGVRPSIGCAIYLLPPAWPSGFSSQPDCFLAVCVQRKIASEKLWRQRRPTHGKTKQRKRSVTLGTRQMFRQRGGISFLTHYRIAHSLPVFADKASHKKRQKSHRLLWLNDAFFLSSLQCNRTERATLPAMGGRGMGEIIVMVMWRLRRRRVYLKINCDFLPRCDRNILFDYKFVIIRTEWQKI